MDVKRISKEEFYKDEELIGRVKDELITMGVSEKESEKYIGEILEKMGIEVVEEIPSEDAKNAELVSRLELEEETLEMIGGGNDEVREGDELFFCVKNLTCYTIYRHYDDTNKNDQCWTDYNCVAVFHL